MKMNAIICFYCHMLPVKFLSFIVFNLTNSLSHLFDLTNSLSRLIVSHKTKGLIFSAEQGFTNMVCVVQNLKCLI